MKNLVYNTYITFLSFLTDLIIFIDSFKKKNTPQYYLYEDGLTIRNICYTKQLL